MKKQGNELFVNLSLVIDYLNARGGSKQPAATSKQPASNQQATSKHKQLPAARVPVLVHPPRDTEKDDTPPQE